LTQAALNKAGGERITPEDLSNLKLANHRLAEARAALTKAEGAVEFMQTAISLRYELKEGDGVNLEDGTIIRAEGEGLK
jgi:hypothetical protein